MEEFMKKKGKEGTRGAKQIASENVETITFYRNMILGACGIYFTGMILEGATYGATEISMFVLVGLVYVGCYQFFARVGMPKVSPSGQLEDPGVDLNMNGGVSEHVKDLLILTTGVHIMSLISNYMWLLLLLAPLRAFHMLWVSVISPWLFAPPPEVDEEHDAKKQRKQDRKMRRMR